MFGVKGQDQGRAIGQIHLLELLCLIVTETLTLVYEKAHQI